MKKIGVVGAGHVGLVTAGCFASMGHSVICADNDSAKISQIRDFRMPFYEPGLEDLVRQTVGCGRLSFTTSISELALGSEVIFIAVGTPPADGGGADLSYVENVTVEIARALVGTEKKHGDPVYRLIVEKSTVPVLTGEWVKRTLALLAPTGIEFDVAANPEFLREGNAIADFMNPDRIVVGVESDRAKRIFGEIYSPMEAPVVVTDVKSAEIIKHASNSFLALKISYINAISRICEKVGADISKVSEGMGYDRRIGKDFLDAGIGWGGSCFPKDVSAFIKIAEDLGCPFNLLKEVERINREQRLLILRKARDLLWNLRGKPVSVYGLSFKPDTDDIRQSPAVEIVRLLLAEGARVRCYDPQAMENVRRELPDATCCDDPYEAARNSSLLIFLTAWKEFESLDFGRIKNLVSMPYIIDGRNFLNAAELEKYGFIYRGIGKNT